MTKRTDNHEALLEKGQMALRAMQMRKKAAEYQAVAAELEAAIHAAEHGDNAQLLDILDSGSGTDSIQSFQSEAAHSAVESAGERPDGMETQNAVDENLPEQSSASDSLGSFQTPPSVGSPDSPLRKKNPGHPDPSPWATMQRASKNRRALLSRFWPNSPVDSPASSVDRLEESSCGESDEATSEPSVTESAADDLVIAIPVEQDQPSELRAPLNLTDKRASLTTTTKATKTKVQQTSPVAIADSAKARQLVAAVLHKEESFDWKKATTLERLRHFAVKKAAVLLSSWFLSLLAHVALIIVLITVAVTVSQDQERVAVVASEYESDEVLMETPLEEPLEIESDDITDPSPEMPQLNSTLADSLETPTLNAEAIDAIDGEIALAAETVTGGAISEMLGTAMSAEQLSGAKFFGAAAAGNTFVYIVDSSGSMKKDQAFDYAKNELMRSLSSMKESQRFFIIFFDRDLDMLTLGTGEPEKYPVHATKENLAQTAQWMQRVRIDGGASPLNALREAFKMEPDGIFLLFDGVTSVDMLTPLRKENRVFDLIDGEKVRVPIHAVCFFNREEEGKMRQLAQENGGTYQFVPNPNELP